MKLITTNYKIAVFGSSGMAGSAICRALKRKGYNNLLLPKKTRFEPFKLFRYKKMV